MTGQFRRPRLSVGLVVYNGEAFLEETIRSLLLQTFTDFELIVSDNASTDETPAIVARLAASDPRLRSHIFPTNQGPAANYNQVARLATGTDYFMWSAADDVREPTFLERCVEALDRQPEAVLAYSQTTIIEDGRSPRPYDYEPDIDDSSPAERLRALLFVDHRRHGAFEIFGVMRIDVLRDVLPQGAYARSDSVILARMALRGTFVRVPEHLFLNRNHPDRSVRTVPARSYNGVGTVVGWLGSGPVPADEWWDAGKKGRIVWPEWHLAREYAAAIAAAPLSRAQRRACLGVLTEYLFRHVPKFGRDVLVNAEFQLRKSTDRGRVRSPSSS
jgi:glycosyltransferase involved in cell wall biosynthesis